MRRQAAAVALLAALLLAACGSGGTGLRAVTDDSTCEDVQEIVEEAIRAAQSYLGRQADDPAERDDIIFALSGAEERRECLDDDTLRRATGLRLTLFSD